MATTVSSNEQPNSVTTEPALWKRWAGRVSSGLPVLMLLLSASLKLMHAPSFVETWTTKLGWHEGALGSIGLLELACLITYAIPRTAILGAVLLTGYLGGAIATHVRIGDPFAIPVVLGLLLWGGLYLRDSRLQALLPLRR